LTYTPGGAADDDRPSVGAPPVLRTSGGGRGAAIRTTVAVVLALAVGLTGGVLIGRNTVAPSTPIAAPAPTASTPIEPNTPQRAPTPTPTAAASATTVPVLPALPAADADLAAPAGIAIPRLGIEQSLVQLGVNPDRTLEVPVNGTDIGWWRSGPVPGEAGNAVLAGHVNWNGGQPAVFADLYTLTPADEIRVNREDGSVATYQVTGVEQHPKNDFPNDRIYRLDGAPALTLITCGGDFVGSHYTDNIIVFAHLVADTRVDSNA